MFFHNSYDIARFDDHAETPNHASIRKSMTEVIFPRNDGIDVKNWQSRFKRAKMISRALVGVGVPYLRGKARPKIKLPMMSVPPERLKWPHHWSLSIVGTWS